MIRMEQGVALVPGNGIGQVALPERARVLQAADGALGQPFAAEI
jgi:hypothetical protein